jgi:ligand-binding sensor domain-containing protein
MNGNTRWRWITALAVVAVFLAASLAFIRWRALDALNRSVAQFASERQFRFSVGPVPENFESKFDWIATPAVFSAAAEFQGHLFLSGPAGLYEFDAAGNLLRRFLVGRQLPPAPLSQIVLATLADSDQPELLIATAGQGLLAFNGNRFRQILPDLGTAREITAILPLASGQMLLGAGAKGVLVYDGKHLEVFHTTLENVRVTALAGNGADLWVGTMDRGVLHWHGGDTDAFAEAQGLPDSRVLSLRVSGDQAFVGTPLGVAEFDRGRFARVLGRGAFAQALGLSGGSLLIGTLDQGVIRVPLAAGTFLGGFAQPAQDLGEIRQIFSDAGGVYALTRSGLYELGGGGIAGNELIHPPDAVLTDANISALSVDAEGKLWVGFFNRGLDVVDAAGHTARHVENDRVFCVNRIVPVGSGQVTAVATANGLALFDREGNERQVLTRADGLIADDVTDVAVGTDRLILATPAGITFLDRGGARSLYAFEGLVNNHVYALGDSRGELLAGTLGGLSVLAGERVLSSYTTSNSGLDRNWISAIAPLGSEWLVGTYGGGVMRLDGSGRFHSCGIATGNFDVNPNAMLSTASHVLAGSLGGGLFAYDRSVGRWSRITEGLPSENVTALAAGAGYIYIGTDDGLVRVRERDLEP